MGSNKWVDTKEGNRHWLVAALAILAGLLPFLPHVLDFSQVLLYRDLSLFFIPMKARWLEGMLTEGGIPRWDYHLAGGSR